MNIDENDDPKIQKYISNRKSGLKSHDSGGGGIVHNGRLLA